MNRKVHAAASENWTSLIYFSGQKSLQCSVL